MSAANDLKAAAFDLLMRRMQDTHTEVGRVDVVTERTLHTVRTKRVPVYEWRIRCPGTCDLAQALLDEAAKLKEGR